MKNYLIENGNAYEINGDKAYLVKFSVDGSMETDLKKSIDIKGKNKYSFYEIERKLNISEMIENDEVTEEVVQAVAEAIVIESEKQEKTVETIVEEIVEEANEEKPNKKKKKK